MNSTERAHQLINTLGLGEALAAAQDNMSAATPLTPERTFWRDVVTAICEVAS